MSINIVEGFYFKLYDDSIFYVKGVAHPSDKFVAFPKYLKYIDGDRVSPDGARYTKIAGVEHEYRVLLERYSNYIVYDEYFGRKIPLVPLKDIARIYNPVYKALKIIESNADVNVLTDVRNMLLDIISATSVKNIGVSGSILVDLYRDDSDIDIVVFGNDEGRKVYGFLKEAIDKPSSKLRRYDENNIAKLYLSRVSETPIDFKTFLSQEKRRVLEGLYGDREYFIRLIDMSHKDDVYSVYRCKKLGGSIMKLRVIDAKKSIYTPCRYGVEVVEVIEGVNADVEEIYSLRGRFNEIAYEDEVVIAKGSIEMLEYRNKDRKYRLYLGDAGDYMYIAK